ncbi:helix-turn-helix domain-containing protein [Hymenobacter artigasi]|uniref:Excisionase family DNA binding protein n=1 Tax=Hymenobacter artigasi TaxID=2719616 RepID=A0ABX1HHT2_9BACT|nr:helix-turn-helix domain-containing protein [Hymenobacter artigasi]NKI88328.1 excisionase family DNA binding protein [Hymenobacter artigasi]
MNINLSPAEVNAIADQISASVLARVTAAMQQAAKTSPALGQLTVKEVADQLQVSEKTIHKYLNEGKLRGSNLGTCERPTWRISQLAIQNFLDS